MKIVCSYCKKQMGEKAPYDNPDPTHGICPECEEFFARQWNGLSLAEYLDDFDEPILVVNEDVRVMAYNQAYSKRYLGKERKERGLLSGEFMQCHYARLPGGCGNTICCRDCMLHKTITETLKTGESQKHVKAYLVQWVQDKPVKRELMISTEKKENAVVVTIENVSDPKPA
jgi:hypothetical protein